MISDIDHEFKLGDLVIYASRLFPETHGQSKNIGIIISVMDKSKSIMHKKNYQIMWIMDKRIGSYGDNSLELWIRPI